MLNNYSKQPQDTRYDITISPPSATSNIPRVFVRCPISHYNIKITCHQHDKEFTCWRWTHNLVNSVSGYNPRVAYNLFGNVLIIQQIYLCIHGCSIHKERPLSVNISNTLPQVTRNALPFILSHIRVCTSRLMDYVNSQVLLGINLLHTAEGIAFL